MNAIDLHLESIIVDGLNASNFQDPRIFERLHQGGVTAVNATFAAWHTPLETIHLLASAIQQFETRANLIMQVRDVDDIARAKASNRVGVILGFQGTDPIGDDIRLLGLYRALGVRIAQLTYNFRNLVGCGCLEPQDTGLSDFGRAVVVEMNRLGMLIDLSHCGPQTTIQTIELSDKPVAITHSNPATVLPHPRNKSDEILKALASKGGVVGAVVFPAMLTSQFPATLDDYVRTIDYLVNLVGIDHVGLGPDFMEEMTAEVSAGALKGMPPEAQKMMASIPPTQGFESIAACANVTAALLAHGYRAEDVKKIMGENWLSLYRKAW